jgi:membrane-associated protease RseP (regulator of RpoE activity)
MNEPPRPWPEGPPLPFRRPGYPIIELLPPAADMRPAPPPPRPKYWLAVLLLLLTVVTTTTLGPVFYIYTRTDLQTVLPLFLTPNTLLTVWRTPALLHIGLTFSLSALFILLCHELGHYIACRLYRLPSTLPYFLPVPINFGTFGAFIRIRAPIRTKRELFDVGVAGPIAGFVALIPFLLYGIAHSQPVPLVRAPDSLATAAVLAPGRCLAIVLATRLLHGPLPAGTYLNLHPTALAAWFGLLATSINLLPLGQLDGGHILYAATGRLQRRLALPLWLALGLAGFFWPGWLLWCLIVLLIGLYHPPVRDERIPLDRKRQLLAWLALVMLILSFMPVPIDEIPVR